MNNRRSVKNYFNGEVKHVWGTEVSAIVFPAESLPEVAFIGRSNVGKSSLINALMRRNKLARTSSKPGATKGIHFFNVLDEFMLVDLPGYGYAKMSKEMSFKIARMSEKYFSDRRSLKKVYVLVDGRRGLKDVDRETLTLLADNGVQSQIVLTKMDKVRGKAADKVLSETKNEALKIVFVDDNVIVSSSEKGDGLDEIKLSILKACDLK